MGCCGFRYGIRGSPSVSLELTKNEVNESSDVRSERFVFPHFQRSRACTCRQQISDVVIVNFKVADLDSVVNRCGFFRGGTHKQLFANPWNQTRVALRSHHCVRLAGACLPVPANMGAIVPTVEERKG